MLHGVKYKSTFCSCVWAKLLKISTNFEKDANGFPDFSKFSAFTMTPPVDGKHQKNIMEVMLLVRILQNREKKTCNISLKKFSFF